MQSWKTLDREVVLSQPPFLVVERHTVADVVVRQQRQMLRQLFSHALVVSTSEHRREQPPRESSKGLHVRSSAFTVMKRSIKAVVCAHSCASVRSRRRPAAVSR